MSNAFLYRMPAGFAGAVTRLEVAKIEPNIMDPDTPVTVYGVPVIKTSGKICPFAGSGTIYGFLVRPYPTQSETNTQVIGSATPSENQTCDILRSGYMTVKNTLGTAAIDGAVYVNDTTGLVQASAVGGTAVTGAAFMGAADADGNVEIVYNI